MAVLGCLRSPGKDYGCAPATFMWNLEIHISTANDLQYLEIEFTKTFSLNWWEFPHLSCPMFLLVIFFGHRKTITLTPYLSEPPPSGGYVGVLNCLVLVSLVSWLIHSFNHTPRSIFRWFPAAGKIHHEIQVLIQSFQISTLGVWELMIFVKKRKDHFTPKFWMIQDMFKMCIISDFILVRSHINSSYHIIYFLHIISSDQKWSLVTFWLHFPTLWPLKPSFPRSASSSHFDVPE